MAKNDFVIKDSVLTEYNDEVVIPYGVKEIGEGIFEDSSASKIIIPDTVEIIGDEAFRGAAFKEINLPDSVLKIGNSAFEDCINLESVRLPKDLREIGDMAFYNCESIKSWTVPDSVEKIGKDAFGFPSGLEYIKLPKNLKVLGRITVEEPNEVARIELDKDNENFVIENDILYDKEKTKALYGWGDFLISDGALIDYRGEDRDVIIPKGVRKINEFAFSEKSIETVTMCDDVEEIETDAFSDSSMLKSVIFSDNIKVISDILNGCENLEYLRLPKLLKKIEEDAFFCTSKPKRLEIDPRNKNFYIKNGALYDKNNRKISFEEDY